MVWATEEDYLGPRPKVHVTLWQSTGRETRHCPESIDRLSPPDGWPFRTKEPMD